MSYIRSKNQVVKDIIKILRSIKKISQETINNIKIKDFEFIDIRLLRNFEKNQLQAEKLVSDLNKLLQLIFETNEIYHQEFDFPIPEPKLTVPSLWKSRIKST